MGTASAILSSLWRELDNTIERCIRTLSEYKIKVARLEEENYKLKQKLNTLTESLQHDDSSNINLVEKTPSNEIEISLTQLKDLLDLKKRGKKIEYN